MSRTLARLAALAGILACGLPSGCATPGEPTPPHPVVPLAVADLAARQTGSAVVLNFTLPGQSVGHEALATPPAIEIYRAPLAPGSNPGQKTPWRLVYTIPPERVNSYIKAGRVEFLDPLTSAELSSPSGTAFAYMIRTRAARQRASDDSNFVTMHIHPPPETPANLGISVTESAIVLSWSEPSSPGGVLPAGYHVYRAEVAPPEEGAALELSSANLKSPLSLIGSPLASNFRDSDFEFGRTYIYMVRATAQAGPDTVESADSTPAVVTPRDIFPPAAPRGLEAAVVPATQGTPFYVELSWAISPETDLAGYYVYRGERDDAPGERLTRESLLSPTFRDTSVVAGKRYFYRVSAVDRAGNESALSSAVEAELPQSGP